MAFFIGAAVLAGGPRLLERLDGTDKEVSEFRSGVHSFEESKLYFTNHAKYYVPLVACKAVGDWIFVNAAIKDGLQWLEQFGTFLKDCYTAALKCTANKAVDLRAFFVLMSPKQISKSVSNLMEQLQNLIANCTIECPTLSKIDLKPFLSKIYQATASLVQDAFSGIHQAARASLSILFKFLSSSFWEVAGWITFLARRCADDLCKYVLQVTGICNFLLETCQEWINRADLYFKGFANSSNQMDAF